ncbi:AVAST type 3 anti-phage nuclease/ATPase Avs3a [Klebsiella michiganensis]|uniref:AVAST type 3 anti-phage nuclease/ATPase Avs3a n=1 Tax=Klebsiella michiganensis TaxID=1134687 RepID=UPI0007CCB975|nr:AVAST type 3 anti-phage nuclease/ATPase Avs3a [Klebsiella michiganensis]SAQ62343.1 NACHT domain [Klebsiella michiganensis]HBM3021780.1 NACHT domain-containing protein [Klebsiella michiganensis]HCC7082192.1 NACHT domain-containing protein [Klebsiella michiganensis]HCK0915837.1 NACHT domain-containing protein [Klebsiella michiganensis]
MSDSLLVRTSRDGDQFHYLWAARRILRLLEPQSNLVALTIEGASTTEMGSQPVIEEGEELIDVAEYYGDTELDKATTVRYMQLKHSTLHVNTPFPPSGLQNTIEGFAKRYKALLQTIPLETLRSKLEFWFVTNRPISTNFCEAIYDAAHQYAPRHPNDLEKLQKFTGLKDEALSIFCELLYVEGRQDDLWTQRNILLRESSGYLPDLDTEAPLKLKELVNRKALSESASNPSISKMDVLRALGVDETDLFPAPCLIEKIENAISRKQEASLIQRIVDAAGTPVVIHAEAGVGKSVFSTHIADHLPTGSVSILYDCFGLGQYRNASSYRHHHRTALVQIANEMASYGLCHPLLPNASTDVSNYMRAFLHRLSQSISTLRATAPQAVLCIIVDAADNAQMAAEEINETRSFIKDLIREKLPDGVCLVSLCRPHRQALLEPHPDTLILSLHPFDHDETAVHLRQKFPHASERDVDEFHRLSSCNPRVQALSLSQNLPLTETLRLLGPNPKTVEDTIGEVLKKSIDRLRDTVGITERTQIDLICSALAILRPLIPLSVLSAISGVESSAIKSFALDLGRPLIISGETIQFFDEPAETWFQEHFRPSNSKLHQFITKLMPLTKDNAYAASVLPALMLEANQLPELITLAMSSQGLPETSPVERRDIELQRLQFALKAALRAEKYPDAAKLALKAGGECAGDSRQRGLLKDNIDLAAKFVGINGVQELVSRNAFTDTEWLGSRNTYYAAILSEYPELLGEARSRLRIAIEWLNNWSQLPEDERRRQNVTDQDRAAMLIACLNIHGAKAAAANIRRWRPRELSFEAGKIVSRQLLVHARYDELDQLAISAGNDISLIMAIVLEAKKLHHPVAEAAIKRCWRLLKSPHIYIKNRNHVNDQTIAAVTSMVEMALKLSICNKAESLQLLTRYLPEVPPYALISDYSEERTDYIRAYALHAALKDSQLTLTDLSSSEAKKEINAEKRYSESDDFRKLKQYSGTLIPWYNLWAKVVLGKVDKNNLKKDIENARQESISIRGHSYSEHSPVTNDIANIWFDILIEMGGVSDDDLETIIEWSQRKETRVYTPTLHRFSSVCSQISGLEKLSYTFAEYALSLWKDEHSDAQVKAEGYIDLSRSLISLDESEAKEYFNQAIEVTNKLGDENLNRWEAILDLAEYVANTGGAFPEIAYKLSRCAEVTREYAYRDKHFAWNDTVEVLAQLCPSSALAIISRWRDRTFGNHRDILAWTIEQLVKKNKINASDALPFIAFQDNWNECDLLESVLSSCANNEEKLLAFEVVYQYTKFESQSIEMLKRLSFLAASIGIEHPELKERIAAYRDTENPSVITSHSPNSNSSNEWEPIFKDCNLSTSDGIYAAYEKFRYNPVLYSMGSFIKEAISRLQIGKERDFIMSLKEMSDWGLYDFKGILESIPDRWASRLSIKTALAELIKKCCQRFCMRISKNRYYEVFPFNLAKSLSGMNEDDISSTILNAIAESPEPADSNRLFSLVGLLVGKLKHDEALNVLSYALDLFNDVLKEEDGDGPWDEQLSPPTYVEDSLAGYIWARLASPDSTIRWQAAHAVLTLCRMKRNRVLQGIFQHATNNTTLPFCDRSLPFYTLHAQLWLMIATARASIDYGKVLLPYIDYFYHYATTTQPHVLVRLFSARTLLALHDARLISISDEEQNNFQNINQSTYDPTYNEDKGHIGEDSYSFGTDFGPYWLKPLGRCFGVSQKQLEPEMLHIIRNNLGFKGSRRWDEDERSKRRYYEYSDTSHSHGSYPRVDDYHFYLSYHAMFITAGKLLATRPLVADPYDDGIDDVFQDWLSRHDISRNDNRWLSDRRDPQPQKRPDWFYDTTNNLNEWVGSISANVFDEALSHKTNSLTVWGHWSEIGSDRKESIAIHSALVSPERSLSLLRALQTTGNVYDYKIPCAGESLEINQPSYQLRGWIRDINENYGIDEFDPWAGNVRFPIPEPASFIIEAMKLTTDKDHRIWSSTPCAKTEMVSSIWGHLSGKNDDEKPHGYKLCASIDFIKSMLTILKMDLIIEVDIDRYSRNDRYGRSNENELDNIPSSTRLFLVRHDGIIQTLYGNYRIGEKTS